MGLPHAASPDCPQLPEFVGARAIGLPLPRPALTPGICSPSRGATRRALPWAAPVPLPHARAHRGPWPLQGAASQGRLEAPWAHPGARVSWAAHTPGPPTVARGAPRVGCAPSPRGSPNAGDLARAPGPPRRVRAQTRAPPTPAPREGRGHPPGATRAPPHASRAGGLGPGAAPATIPQNRIEKLCRGPTPPPAPDPTCDNFTNNFLNPGWIADDRVFLSQTGASPRRGSVPTGFPCSCALK